MAGEPELRVCQAVRLAHLAYWEDDFDANQVRWSAEGAQMLGVPPDEGWRPWQEVMGLVHPDDRGLMAGSRESAMRGESGYRLAFRVVQRDGTIRHLMVIIDVIRDASGRPVRAVGAAQDVTDLRHAQQARILYRALIDRTNDMVEVVDPETGQFLEVNEQACRVHGFTREEYLSRRVSDFDPTLGEPATFARNMAHLRRVGSLTLEGQHRRKDGTVFPVEVSLTYARLDRDYLLAVVRDISERKEAATALRWSQERLHLALEAAGLGPWDWNLRTNEVVYSPEWMRQLGYDQGELANRYEEWESRVHPDDREDVLEALQACLTGHRPEFAVEVRLRHKDGTFRWIHSRGLVLRGADGEPAHILGCHLDVTDRKQLEEQLRQAQKMEAVGQLAAGVAHDFNNLLAVIFGYSDILREMVPEASDEGEMVAAIRDAAERAAGLTRQLLAFSRRTVLEPRVLDLNVIVRENEKMLRRLIGEDILLTIALDPAPEMVRLDHGHVSQVLMNLAVNARDATTSGGRLSIRTRSVTVTGPTTAHHGGAPPGRYMVLTVSDTGVGIAPEIKGRIFEPFFTTKAPGRGTGLGLATVYGIVQQSGGFIAVDSEPHLGTTFRLYFPVAHGAPDDTRVVVNSLTRGSETILLVEDDAAVRAMLRTVLGQAGYTVLDAGGGTAALRLAREYAGAIHLLVTDVVMPGMSGRELQEGLASLRPDIQVLFLSGYTDDAVVRHGVLRSEVAFLQKPFSMATFTAKVRAVLDASPD